MTPKKKFLTPLTPFSTLHKKNDAQRRPNFIKGNYFFFFISQICFSRNENRPKIQKKKKVLEDQKHGFRVQAFMKSQTDVRISNYM